MVVQIEALARRLGGRTVGFGKKVPRAKSDRPSYFVFLRKAGVYAPGAKAHPPPHGRCVSRWRHHDGLTFTQIEFPGAVLTAAFGINDRG
jgi:hypothetical protein